MKPVNLNKFRKEKVRADKKARADENAVKFGLKKADRTRLETERDRAKSHIKGHKIESEED